MKHTFISGVPSPQEEIRNRVVSRLRSLADNVEKTKLTKESAIVVFSTCAKLFQDALHETLDENMKNLHEECGENELDEEVDSDD